MTISKNRKIVFLAIGIAMSVFLVIILARIDNTVYVSPYPDGKNFAFTITDDPDGASLEKVKPVYELLDSLGFKTTIACWVHKPNDLTGMPDPKEQEKSDTLDRLEYLTFLKEYQRKGFEIALHTVTSGNDKRPDTIGGYKRFKEIFGGYPKINIMHSKNVENIYWGRNIFSNFIMKMVVGLYDRTAFSGEDAKSPYFWGDVCKANTKYVRLWGTSDINTLKFNPSMPYHDDSKPYVNYWFSFSDGYTAKYFNALISSKNVKKLVLEKGACIAYTHFAAGFCSKQADGSYVLNKTTENELTNLARQKEGWFVPTSVLLDRLILIKNMRVVKNGNTLIITNRNDRQVDGVTMVTRPFSGYMNNSGYAGRANDEGEIALGDFGSGETKTIILERDARILRLPVRPGIIENLRLVVERLKILVLSHRG